MSDAVHPPTLPGGVTARPPVTPKPPPKRRRRRARRTGGVSVAVLVVLGLMYTNDSGPFEQCVVNGYGVEFCGQSARDYCRSVSDNLAGRTAACNTVLDETEPIGQGGLDEQLPVGDSVDDPAYDPALDDPCLADPTLPGC